jgi:hypothetical protein
MAAEYTGIAKDGRSNSKSRIGHLNFSVTMRNAKPGN